MNRITSFNLLLVSHFLLIHLYSLSQAGLNDPTFNAEDKGYGFGQGCSTKANVARVQADGKIIIGGSFITYNNKAANRIVRVLPDGQRDETFNPYNPFYASYAFNDEIENLLIQPDQKIVAVGYFSTYQGTSRNGIARLNTNGTLDNTFNPGTGVNGLISDVEIQTDGKLIIAGSFTNYNGTAVGRIARLNSNGTIDNTFNPGIGYGNNITNIALQPDGKILVTGSTLLNNVSISNIHRLNTDGTLDNTFLYQAPTMIISDLALQPDGKIIVNNSSQFSTTAAQRLHSDGSLDPSFVVTLPPGDMITGLTLQNDGKVIIQGNFTILPFSTDVSLGRLNSDGSLDATFVPEIVNPDLVKRTTVQNDGKILVSGFYKKYQGIEKNYICRILENGNLDHTFNPATGTNGPIYDMVVSANDHIWIGGDFSHCDDHPYGSVARLKPNGDLDTAFHPFSGTEGIIYALAEQPDGKILIGGLYDDFNDTITDCVIRLLPNGSIDTTFLLRNGLNNQLIHAIAIQPDGKILIGGSFGINNAYNSNRITRLNPDGTTDPTFLVTSGFNSTVTDIKLLSNGQIMVCGIFTVYNGVTTNGIVRLNSDGTKDITFNSGNGPSAIIEDMEIQSDGKIIIGGAFNSYNGAPKNQIARINSNGSLDASFTASAGGSSSVDEIAIDQTGRVIIGGSFVSFNSATAYKILRLNSNGTTDATFNVGTGTDYTAKTIKFQSNNRILIGGSFKEYRGKGRNYMARIFPCAPVQTSQTLSNCNPYYWPSSGATYSASGVYYATVSNGIGCDTLKQLNLTILGLNTSTTTVSACSSYTWPKNNQTYTSSGIYTDTVAVSGFCDSIYTLNLTIHSPNNSIFTTVACDSFTWIDGITYYTSTNTPIYTMTNSYGCDSTITLNLTVVYSTIITENIVNCGAYLWPATGQFYNSSGSYQTNLQNVNGCDSIIFLYLTVFPVDSIIQTVSSCGSYLWPITGLTYTSSGNYSQQLTSINGCDSIISLSLTIHTSDTTTIVETACQSYTWSNSGVSYTTSGIYSVSMSNSFGCDSVVNLNLTILENDTTTLFETACNNYTWSITGNTYATSGSYFTTLTSINGCDSVVNLNLTINTTDSIIDSIFACNSYYWSVSNVSYFSSGIYNHVLTNSQGCDSIHNLYLTIAQGFNDTLFFNGIDSVSVNNQTYNQSGTYVQNFFTSEGCDSTLTLIIDLEFTNLNEISNYFSLYPIPAIDQLNLKSKNLTQGTYIIRDSQGRLITKETLRSENELINISYLTKGIYYMEIEGLTGNLKFIKQ